MSQAGETFFTAVGCMDGRVQDPVADFGRKRFGVKFADTVTEAGLVGKLSKENDSLIDSLKFKVVDVSIGKHHSVGIVVHGHAQCAGNPVDDEKHKEDVRNAAGILRSIVGGVGVVPVFVKKENDSWVVQEL